MSYIRALSNPESLYIIGTSNGDQVGPVRSTPVWDSEKLDIYMPARIFEKLLLRFLHEREEVSHEGAALLWLSQERLDYPPLDFKDPASWDSGRNNPDLYKWRLTYPDRWGAEGVNAWEVTWCYIAQNCKRRRGEKPWYAEGSSL